MPEISGTHYPASSFKVLNVPMNTIGSYASALLSGRIPIVLVRDAMSEVECNKTVRAFITSPCTRPRADGVSGSVLGAYHYAKDFPSYSEDVRAAADCLDGFLRVTSFGILVNSFRRSLNEKGVELRPAKWNGLDASPARALSWTAAGEYMLAPHDDIGQLTEPLQVGFEAQHVVRSVVLAINLYPQVPPGGGVLRVWNVILDHESRIRLGIATTGYPIPADLLSEFNYLDIRVSSGSLLLMNGGLVHAVTGYPEVGQEPGPQRLIVNSFMGYMDSTTAVYWA